MAGIRWIGWQGLVAAGLAAALSAAIWLSHHRAIERERDQIRFLKQEIAKLDRQIVEVLPLKDAIRQFLARKQIIEVLYASRYALPVLEEMARRRPRGVYLIGLQDERRRFLVTGQAASDKEAAAFLANLKESPLIQNAELLEVRSDPAARAPGHPLRFTLRMRMKGVQ